MFRLAARPLIRRALVAPAPAVRCLATAQSPLSSRLRSALFSTALVLGTGAFLVYSHDSRAGIHKWVLLPALGLLTADDPEKAHEMAVRLIGSGLAPVDTGKDDEILALELWGKQFANPVGMAAGFDKHGEAIDGLFGLGFGYVEIGSVTPEPQAGNPKPRVFRIPETNSLVNRYGFNSEGHATVMARLRSRVRQFVADNSLSLPASLFPSPPAHAHPTHDVVAQLLASPSGKDALVPDAIGVPRSLHPGRILAINLGKNKSSDPDSIDDFVNGVHSLGPYADVLVINVSSPNTPGLRNLQRKGMLEELLTGVVAARDSLVASSSSSYKPPVLVKVAPDLDEEQLLDIAAAVQSAGIDGIVVSNTTISRPASAGTNASLAEMGGLSGPPVKPLALAALSALHKATDGKVPLIGCGGISSGQDAIDFARAGATLVQMYTSFIYEGVGLPRKIKDEVVEILKKEKTTWVKIIGSGVPRPPPVVAPTLVAAAETALATEELKSLEIEPVVATSEDDFEFGLIEAQKELEELLSQLTEVEATPELLAAVVESSSTPTIPVPVPVAESLPTPVPELTPTLPSATFDPPSPPPITESPLAIPEVALLDEQSIAVLLDPAVAQVEAGIAPVAVVAPVVEEKVVMEAPVEEKAVVVEPVVEEKVVEKKVEVEKPTPAVSGEGKRWV